MREFYERKKRFIERLIREKERGIVDEPILKLLEEINNSEYFFTLSSCAGRITLMKIPENAKKYNCEFIFKTHRYVDPKLLWKVLNLKYKEINDPIWFKMEPFIIHIECLDVDHAKKLIEIARESGLKRSGIFLLNKRIICEIMSTERIETIVSKNRKLLINKRYFFVLVKEANKKLRRTRKKMKKFYDLFKLTFS